LTSPRFTHKAPLARVIPRRVDRGCRKSTAFVSSRIYSSHLALATIGSIQDETKPVRPAHNYRDKAEGRKGNDVGEEGDRFCYARPSSMSPEGYDIKPDDDLDRHSADHGHPECLIGSAMTKK